MCVLARRCRAFDQVPRDGTRGARRIQRPGRLHDDAPMKPVTAPRSEPTHCQGLRASRTSRERGSVDWCADRVGSADDLKIVVGVWTCASLLLFWTLVFHRWFRSGLRLISASLRHCQTSFLGFENIRVRALSVPTGFSIAAAIAARNGGVG